MNSSSAQTPAPSMEKLSAHYLPEARGWINRCCTDEDIGSLIEKMRAQAWTLTTFPSSEAYTFGIWLDDFADRLISLQTQATILPLDRKAS